MTQHINPGTDTTINPVVIDDSYRETKQKEQSRVDWVEEVRLRCYSYTEFYGGERVIRFDELEGVIQQVKEERKECHDAHAPAHPTEAQQRINAATLEALINWLNEYEDDVTFSRSLLKSKIALLQAGRK